MTTSEWSVPTPTEDEQEVFYGLWDLLTIPARQGTEAKEAQRLYGINTMKSIRILFDLYHSQLNS